MNSSKAPIGYTLIELSLGLAILAILLSLAAPSFSQFLNIRSVKSQAWEIRRALELARGLAVSQHQVWKVCASNQQLQCVKEQGSRLLVFRDSNTDHQLNGGDQLHLNLQIDSTHVKLSASGRAYIRFKATGEAMESGNFMVCPKDKTVEFGRQAIVFRSGRVRLSRDTDGDGYDDSGGGKIIC